MIFLGMQSSFLSTKTFSPRSQGRKINSMMGQMMQFNELIANKEWSEKVVNFTVLEK